MNRRIGVSRLPKWVFTNDLEAVAALPSEMSCKVEFAWTEDEASLRQIDQIAVAEGFRSRLRTMQRHLAEGGRVAVALEAGKPVSWQMFRPHEQVTFVGLHLRAPQAVFSFGAYTVPAWRGRR